MYSSKKCTAFLLKIAKKNITVWTLMWFINKKTIYIGFLYTHLSHFQNRIVWIGTSAKLFSDEKVIATRILGNQ